MKKSFFLVIFIFMITNTVWARPHYNSSNQRQIIFKPGYSGFRDINSGWTWNLSLARWLDNRVCTKLETDILIKNIRNQSVVADSNYGGGLYENTIELNRQSYYVAIPLCAAMDIDLGRWQRLSANYFVGMGGGYQLLFYSLKDYHDESVSTRRNYGGWIWFFRGGVRYQVSRSTSFVTEVSYRHSVVSKSSEFQSTLPVSDNVNLSGLGIRFGIAVAI